MSEEEVLDLWKSGLTKHKVAVIYQRRYNQQIKLIRAEVVNRHAGKLITYMQALAVVEKIIYNAVMRERKWKMFDHKPKKLSEEEYKILIEEFRRTRAKK